MLQFNGDDDDDAAAHINRDSTVSTSTKTNKETPHELTNAAETCDKVFTAL